MIALIDSLGKEITTELLQQMKEEKIATVVAQKAREEKRLEQEARREERRAKRKKFEWDQGSSDDENSENGAAEIPRALEEDSTHSFLVRLGLDTCGLRDSSGVAIAQFVYCSETLEELDISSNQFGPTTAAALAVGIRFSDSLRILHASFNPFGIDGTQAIIGACSTSQPLASPTSSTSAVDATARVDGKRKSSPSKVSGKKKGKKKKRNEKKKIKDAGKRWPLYQAG